MPKGRTWTKKELRFLKATAGSRPYAHIARTLRRTEAAVKCKAQVKGFITDRRVTPAQLDYIKAHQADACPAVAAAIGRSLRSVYNIRHRLRLVKKRIPLNAKNKTFLLRKHAAGWSDAEICAALGCDRHTIGDWRKKFSLPDNALSAHRRQRVAEKTRQQCRAAGVKSLAEIRALAFKKYARRYGWPEDLQPRQVQMLNAMMRRGPMTRRQLADAIGMPWKGSRKSLTAARLTGGSYLAALMHRGLVVQLGRVLKGKGSGRSVFLYSIPLWTERRNDGQQAA